MKWRRLENCCGAALLKFFMPWQQFVAWMSRGNRRLKNFAIQVSKETEDPEKTMGGFLSAEILHKGFYDVDVERVDLEAGIPIVRYTIGSASKLIPDDVKNLQG